MSAFEITLIRKDKVLKFFINFVNDWYLILQKKCLQILRQAAATQITESILPR